jgi:hypothetical protein
MDVFSLLSYINKVSLLAFVVTTLVVGYQVYLLKKEKTKEQTPTIPDFKERNNSHEAANFTGLPASLTVKEVKKVNYSKLVFLIISLLTVMVIVFVLFLIRQNSSVRKEALISPTAAVLPTATPKPKAPSPTVKPIVKPTVTLSPSPTVSLSTSPAASPSSMLLSSLSPSPAASPSSTLLSSLSPSPTEIVLAKAPSLTPAVTLTQGAVNKLQALPETGSIGKGLVIFGVAISAIFFSFLF